MPGKKVATRKPSALAIPEPERVSPTTPPIQRTISLEIAADGAMKITHERTERDY